MCPRYNDKCVKVIERKGAEVLVTRDCLSNLEGFRCSLASFDGFTFWNPF